ncbi:MAG: VacJ family lipoprotein [Legionellales bacterium]|jgi:phospholipid-binding lipoprotein MlaA
MKIKFLILLLTLALYGCASTATPEQAAAFAQEPMITDPYEPFNRAMYGLNKNLDSVLVKPLAQGYVAVTPPKVRESVGNFFGNIEEISVFVNTVLQARFADAGKTAARFAINSTLGILGIFDVAAVNMDLEEAQGDFGQTFYVWGIKRSAYLVLPVLGPTTGREAVGKVPGYFFSVWDFTPWEVQIAAFGLMAIDVRSQYLDQEEILSSAFDEYSLVRDIYIQQREDFLSGQEDVTDWDEDLINEHEVY